jgi:hypothetical protein
MKKEYCITCDKPTKTHCRLCGLPLCSTCANDDGICSACQNIEDDDDNTEYTKDELC